MEVLKMTLRRSHDKGFKAKVALEAIKNEKTINEIASAFEVHPNLVGKWKKELLEKLPEVFDIEKKKDERQIDTEELFKQIGELRFENEYLKKKYAQLLKL